MVDVNVDFIFESEQPINADFQLEPDVTYTADIKLSEATRDHTKLYNRDRANQHPMGAITGLEDALSDEATARQNADIALQENITAESNRAVEVESQIINNLSTEVNRLDVEDARLNQKIDAERQRAKTIEAEISANLVTEKTAREQGDSILSNAIAEEQRRAEQAESELSDKIDTVEDDLTEDIDSLATIVDNNYNTLDTRITNVADELGQQIEENVVALQQEDAALQNQINAHSQTLTSHDTRITNNANAIIQEATDRQSADDVLQDQIDTLSARGRFLSLWDATTGLAESTPQISPYIYKTGDYFIVDKVGEVNYRPTGTEYVIGQASTVVETEELATDDVYYFDGATWHLQINHGKTVSFANLAGSPDDNIALKTALDNKQPVGDYATNTALTQGLATKANDSDVVHKTGNENIDGQKTFNDFVIRKTSIDQGTTTGTTEVATYRVKDTNGQYITSQIAIRSNTDNIWRAVAQNKNSKWGGYQINLNDDGSTIARINTNGTNKNVTTSTASTTSDWVATIGWVNNPSNSTNVVHRSGNETIAGDKTFSNPATFNSTTTFTTGVTNFNNGGYRMWRYRMATNNTYEDVSFYDNAGTFLGSFRVDNTGKAEFITFTSVNAPTPATSDNSTKIATTAFVKAQGYATTEMLDSKQDVITDLDDIRNNISTNTSNISYLDEKVRDIELFKFPNAVIIGEPTISNGQVSGFSASNYMQFPFILDLHNTPFQIDFAFTTGNNVTTQQNILDSEFGLALAIANGKGLMAISGNGTSWNIGSSVGTINILPNTTYYARLTWDGMQYKTLISTNGIDYTQDMYLVGTQRPYPRTIFIGGCSGSAIAHTPHPFLGTINMNKSYLSTRGQVIWQGMDDAGLATRADISLSNLDELGEARFNAKQDKLTAGENITIEDNVISSAGGAVDNKSITKNTDNQIQAVGTINQNTASGATPVKYDWIGTLAEYNSQNVETLHPDWVCFITDDVSGGTSVYTKTEVDNAISTALTAMLDSAFPVGYRYITEASTCPLATLIPNSTWVLTSQGRVIQGADSNHASGTTAEAGLPEIGGKFSLMATYGGGEASGGFTQTFLGTTGSPNTVSKAGDMEVRFSASRSNSIYGNSTTVQPPAEFVNIFKRIA